MPYPSSQPVYRAARLWRDRALLDDLSLFGESRTSTLAAGEELIRDFVNQPDAGQRNFLSKLADRIGQSSTAAVQLAAELLYAHALLARTDSLSGARKRKIVDEVLAYRPGTHPIPKDLARALQSGLVRPGQAYNQFRWSLFAFLIRAFVELKVRRAR